MTRFPRVIAAAVSMGVIGAIALTGCSSDSDDGSETSENGSSPSLPILASAAEATDALTGAHFRIEVDGTLQALNIASIEGDITNTPADAAEGTATVKLGPEQESETPFVYVDDTFYANINDDGYLDYGDGSSIYDVSVLLNSDQGLASVLRAIEDATEEGSETIDGVETTKVSGIVPAEAVARLSGSVRPGPDGELPEIPESDTDITAEVWITGDNQVAQLVVKPENPPAEQGEEPEEVTMTIKLSEWDKTVEVQAPDNVVTPTEAPEDAENLEETRAPIGG